MTGLSVSAAAGHDGLHLLEVVDVERRQAVAVLGRVVEQLAHRNEGHAKSPGEAALRAGGGRRVGAILSRPAPARLDLRQPCGQRPAWRALQVASTSSPGTFHQRSEKISTSCAPR